MALFNVGDDVQDRNDPTRYGSVKSVFPVEGGAQYYKVLWPYPYGLTSVLEESIQLFNPEREANSDFYNSNFSGYEEFLRLITLKRLSKGRPIKNTLYAFNASRTRFYPYQFKPLIKFLDSEKHRILICDEVGLGKTIEAGLILIEFKARFASKRILIVCPSALKEKWRDELKKRFDEDFKILDSQDFREVLTSYSEAPEKTLINGIVSLETIRSGSVLPWLKEVSPDFDLVIVDEAHHLRNPGRKQWQAATQLSENATAMVMLTATPVQLGRENLFTLLRILDEKEFPERHGAEERFSINENVVMAQNAVSHIPPNLEAACSYLESAGKYEIIRSNPYFYRAGQALKDLFMAMENKDSKEEAIKRQIDVQKALASLNLISHIYTRTRRRDVHENFTRRQAFPILVKFTPLEKEFYDAVTQYVRSCCAQAGYPTGMERMILNIPQRRIASSIPAMVEFYRNKLVEAYPSFEPLYEGIDDLDSERTELGLESEGNSQKEDEVAPDFDEALGNLKSIVLRWPENAVDSKYEAFIKEVRKVIEKEEDVKILVFSFFKGTLKYLEKKLTEEGINTLVIHGEIKTEERFKRIGQFRDDPSVRIMLSSKVGSEGLDFQFCHVMFNYDLPWNPMEVEQRIGRLDRIGQESPFISIYHFWIEGTIEERILKRLYERIGVFERSIGELELILGEIARDLENEVLSAKLTEEGESAALQRNLMILKRREDDLAKIESDAARFIGTDSFFDQEIEKFRKSRLYITPGQIRALVEDFFKTQTPQTKFEYDPVREVGRLHPGQDLLDVLAQENCLKEFFSITAQTRVREVTFNGEVAFNKPKVEFLNILHPITKAIISYYDRNSYMRSSCHYICLDSEYLDEGVYFFFSYIVDIRAARDEHRLQVILLNDYMEEACDGETSEFIFGEILEKGKSPEIPSPVFEASDMKNVSDTAELVMQRRINAMKEDLNIANDVFIDRRIQTLTSFFERYINQKQERLYNEEKKELPDERIIRLLKGDIRNRKTEMKAEIEKLEARRSLAVEYRPLSMGCLEIGNF
ncbi:MAG: helicase-related protein [Aminivibrio sp.]|jgi:SNF2 family DNA or RNA helicase